MDIYLAPLEGVTGHVFREAYDLFFKDIDKYFTPFLSANDHLNNKTIRELGYIEHKGNSGESFVDHIGLSAPLVPQILGNDADKTLDLIKEIRELCLSDVRGVDGLTFNLNFGCPSGTVTAKGRGSGIFKDLCGMGRYLDKVFAGCESMKVKLSLKSRVGWNDPKEWPEIVRIYADYPFEEIIIHPRVRADMYNGKVRPETFEYAMEHLKVPLCYNGDILTKDDFDRISRQFPTLGKIMIGRGIVRNPALVSEILDLESSRAENYRDKIARVRSFIEALEKGYLGEIKREEHAIMRMKEFWFYYEQYVEGFEAEKRDIKKAKTLNEYMRASRAILNHMENA